MRFDVVTLFPSMFSALTEEGITARAIDKGIVDLRLWQLRDFAKNRYKTIDDRPYGGGPGMLLMPDPLATALDTVKQAQTDESHVVYLSPQGEPLTQQKAVELSAKPSITLIAGRYEGIDERIIQTRVDSELSIGDYVLAGGELPAMVLIETIARLLPGTLGNEQSVCDESFNNGLLDYPHYTRPEVFEGITVPSVLLSGNHQRIEQWRHEQSVRRTQERRSDLLSATAPGN